MFWVIQTDLDNDNRRGDLINALNRLDIPFIAVSVDNNTVIPEISLNNKEPIITNGSIMLSNIAIKRGWVPGSLLNENFSYNVWSKHYQNLILNKNAKVSSIKDAEIAVTDDRIFVRPILDNKIFNGKVFTRTEFIQFKQDSVNYKAGTPKPETEILIAKPKSIGQEHRHYIVDNKVITSSRYKLAGQPNFSEGCDENVLNIVNKAIEQWQPARAFVLDTYIAGEEIGIVEIGCICHAGLYKSDLIKLVSALDGMGS